MSINRIGTEEIHPLFLNHLQQSKTVEASSFDEVMSHLKGMPPNSLIAIDCDHVLMIRNDKVLRPCSRALYRQMLAQLHEDLQQQTKNLGKRTIPLAEYLQGVMIREAQIELVDQRIPSLLSELQKANHSVLVLTAGKVGPFAEFDAMEDCRIQQLKSLGVNVSNQFKNSDPLAIEIQGAKSHPIFKQGVLLTGKESKAKCLQAIFDHFNSKWQHIYFIDDRRDWIDEVFHHFQNQIPITAIHYADGRFSSEQTDETIAKIQFNHLRQFHHWLSDEEAHKKGNNK